MGLSERLQDLELEILGIATVANRVEFILVLRVFPLSCKMLLVSLLPTKCAVLQVVFLARNLAFPGLVKVFWVPEFLENAQS